MKLIIKNLNQNIIKHNLQAMTAIFKGLFRWSLQITGASIVWYNYQTYEKQQKILGIYSFLKNSYRFSKCLYGLSQDFNAYHQNVNAESLTAFRISTARRLEELCEQNLGAYARIAEVLSGMTDIIPEEYRSEFKKLSNRQLEEIPYSEIKLALTSIFQKDTKELFDGFQTRPHKVGYFTQTHKAVLLQNYREAVVKVLLPSLKVQAQHDIWFINKVKEHVIEHLKKHNISEESVSIFVDALKEAENVVQSQLNLEQQVSNADKNKQLMYESNSAFYVPYYFSKFCNQNVIMRQLVEGAYLNDPKGLKQLGISTQVAYAYVLSEIHHLMKKSNLINGSLHPSNIMIRKYIKPYKTQTTESEIVKQEIRQTKGRNAKPASIIHPPYQVIFLSQNNLQSISTQTTQNITTYWNNLKKEKQKVLPSVSSFYERLPNYKQLKTDARGLLNQKIYLYEPLLRLYESLVKK